MLLLINSMLNNVVEKDVGVNLIVWGFDIIDVIKIVVEKICFGKVLCVDIIVLVIRDFVVLVCF